MKPSPLHEIEEFAELIRVVAAERGVPVGMAEKDYWVGTRGGGAAHCPVVLGGEAGAAR